MRIILTETERRNLSDMAQDSPVVAKFIQTVTWDTAGGGRPAWEGVGDKKIIVQAYDFLATIARCQPDCVPVE